MGQEQKRVTLRDMLTVVFKYKVGMLLTFVLTFAAVTAFSFLRKPVYEAHSSILVKFGREHAYRPEVGDHRPAIYLTPQEVINTELEILTSRDLLEKVVDTLSPARLYPTPLFLYPRTLTPREAAIHNLKKNLSAEAAGKSNVLDVRFGHENPETAARAVNLLVDLYREKHLQVFSDPESDFLESQYLAYETQMREAEKKLDRFMEEHGVFSFQEQMSLLLQQKMTLDADLKETENRVKALQESHGSLETQLAEFSDNPDLHTETERERVVIDGKSQLLTLKLKRMELLENYTDTSRRVADVKQRIELVKQFLQEEEEDIRKKVRSGNAVYMDVKKDIIRTEAERRGLESKRNVLRAQLAQVDGKIRSLSRGDQELQSLQRELEVNEKNYRLYRDKVEESHIASDMNRQKIANISIIQAAGVPLKPVSPRLGLNLLIGTFLAFFSSCGYAFLREYLTQVFSTPEGVERRLGVPVLATLGLKKN